MTSGSITELYLKRKRSTALSSKEETEILAEARRLVEQYGREAIEVARSRISEVARAPDVRHVDRAFALLHAVASITATHDAPE